MVSVAITMQPAKAEADTLATVQVVNDQDFGRYNHTARARDTCGQESVPCVGSDSIYDKTRNLPDDASTLKMSAKLLYLGH